MKINQLNSSSNPIIIAEIGNNHEGNVELAKRMIHAASEAGADVVKFQTFITEHYVNKKIQPERFKRLKGFELSWKEFELLFQTAKDCGIEAISTPFCIESARFLNQHIPVFKIGSSENIFYPLLDEINGFGKPVILSTGQAQVFEIEFALSHLTNCKEIALLHCVSSYPVEPEDCNLRSINYLKSKFGLEIGYSDHSIGLQASLAAVALGATIIEKHFTLDKNLSDFRDHQLSLTPNELKELVRSVREVSAMLGTEEKIISKAEEASITGNRRSVVANKSLQSGHIISFEDLTWTRPSQNGFMPGEEEKIVGRKIKYDLEPYDIINQDNLSNL